MEKFRELVVWQRAHALCLWMYQTTQTFPKHELFGLTSQMRRNGQSIPSNIAEGSKRRTIADWNHYNVIAEGSLEELKYQIILSHDLGYLTDARYDEGMRLCQEVGYLLHAYSKSLK